MPDSGHDWLIVDGNNLLHQMEEFRDLVRLDFDSARQALARKLEAAAGDLAGRITLVFDGRIPSASSQTPAPQNQHRGFEVIFSPAHLTADSVIERLVSQSGQAARITVVSSDLGIRQSVSASGAYSISGRTFLEQLARRQAHVPKPRPAPRTTLGDYFPNPPSASE